MKQKGCGEKLYSLNTGEYTFVYSCGEDGLGPECSKQKGYGKVSESLRNIKCGKEYYGKLALCPSCKAQNHNPTGKDDHGIHSEDKSEDRADFLPKTLDSSSGFNLEEIKKKPVKELTNHEFYLRYKEVITEVNRRNYSKYSFGKYVKKYEEKNKDKVKAKDRANYYIKIPEEQLCQVCNEEKAIQKHHEDYSKPLEVLFVCRSCHGELDRKRRLKE